MPGKLTDKVAIVTGASSGIGEATAIAMAQEGAKVTVVARREERLKALTKNIAERGGQALPVVADISHPGQCKNAVDSTIERWGSVDILVNNAGVMYLGSVAFGEPEDWKRMFDINVLGLMYCTHAVLPAMKKRGSGHIVNISSVSGRQVSARSAAYSATKFAVGAFSEGLRKEVQKEKIRVTIIEPGAVLTELTDHIPDKETKDTVKKWVEGMTALTSEDIAASIMYAICQPQHVNVDEILIRPTDQA